jgi:hypothetical protein
MQNTLADGKGRGLSVGRGDCSGSGELVQGGLHEPEREERDMRALFGGLDHKSLESARGAGAGN